MCSDPPTFDCAYLLKTLQVFQFFAFLVKTLLVFLVQLRFMGGLIVELQRFIEIVSYRDTFSDDMRIVS